jgi:hypothetical protein
VSAFALAITAFALVVAIAAVADRLLLFWLLLSLTAQPSAFA